MAVKLTKSVLFEMTEEEAQIIQELAEIEGTSARNVLRRAVKVLAEKAGKELPKHVFADRAPGNWGKENQRPTPSPALI